MILFHLLLKKVNLEKDISLGDRGVFVSTCVFLSVCLCVLFTVFTWRVVFLALVNGSGQKNTWSLLVAGLNLKSVRLNFGRQTLFH